MINIAHKRLCLGSVGLSSNLSQRMFSSKVLQFARLSENGQGNLFKYHHEASKESQAKVNFSYSTFWNDFSHYSVYDDASISSSEA